MSRGPLLVVIFLLSVCAGGAAQSTETNKAAAAKNLAASTRAANDAEAERLIKERRANAQSLLISLAADAGAYNDQKLRARTQARIADALWDADPDRARTLFRKAWDAAEIADQESQRRLQQEVAEQKKKSGSFAVSAPSNLRGEVLRLAARRDRALGEEFLDKLKIATKQEANEAADKLSSSFDATEAASQRLDLARQLLNSDQVERALQFADPVLTSINRSSIDFLSYLREKDTNAADKRYAAMLSSADASLQSDANTVSLLSSYLFTPHMFVSFSGSGSSTTQSSRGMSPPEVAPQLRAAFFNVAADILLRPLAPPGQDQTTSGIEGKYLMMKRLMPLFEQFAPKEMAEALRGQMQALATTVSEEARQRDDATLREGIRPQEKIEDREQALQDRIDRAKTSADRDRLNLQMARMKGENGDMRAHDYVEKIEDSELRQKVRAYVDTTMALRAVDRKDTDQALQIARTGELTHLVKTWVFTQSSKLLTKTDREKAFALLEDATAEARRIDGSDADRPRALMAVANAVFVIDRGKTWDAVYDAAKAANSAEDFTGEDGVVRISLITASGSSVRSSSVQDFDLAGIFGELAKDDYNRAVEVARGFQREAPRAGAVIAIARAVLNEKQK